MYGRLAQNVNKMSAMAIAVSHHAPSPRARGQLQMGLGLPKVEKGPDLPSRDRGSQSRDGGEVCMQFTHRVHTLKPQGALKVQTQTMAETPCPGGEPFPKEGLGNRIFSEHSLEQPERSEEPSASETPGPSCHSPSLRFSSSGQWPILIWRSILY